MAINPECFDAVFRAAGRELNEKELKELGEELERRDRLIQAEDTSLTTRESALAAADQLAAHLNRAAIIEKHNAALNLTKRLELETYLKNTWGDDPVNGWQTLLTGTQRARPGARRSVALEQESLQGKYMGGLIADLERLNHTKLFASGALDQDIARAMWLLDDEKPNFRGLQPEAVEIARSIRKWQDTARLDANKEGAAIGKEKGYIVRQSHDLYRIRKAGYEEWSDFILPRLDTPTTMSRADAKDVDTFLRATYEGLASGVHLKAATRPTLTGFKGPANLAKKLSQERVLHFKDADAWYEYNLRFGSGSVRQAVFSGLRRAAQSTGLMRILGTNPEAMVKVVGRSQLERVADPETKRKLNESFGSAIANRLAQVDGSVNIPGNAIAARVSANLRAIQSMAKLGGAVISSITDVPIYASEVRFQGRGFFTGLSEALGAVATGRPKAERAQVLSSLGVFFDSMIGEIIRRGSLDDTFSGGVARAQMRFFKYNLLNWWTESLRGSAALGLSRFMADESRKAWSAVAPEMRRMLGLYGIDEAAWAHVNKARTTLADGNEHLTPEGMRDVEIPGVSKERAAQTREQIEDALRAFYIDRAHIAVIEPDAETMALMRQGTRSGTAYGELLRFISQFKSFGIAVTQKVLGREAFGYGANTLGEALGRGESLRGLVQVILTTTLFGYGAMTAKDLLRGKTPRDPTSAATWLSAATQGGGFGIYGDFVLGQQNRFGRTALDTLAGPVLGSISDLDELRARALSGDDVAAPVLKQLVNNTPYVNMFYTRMALDYLILYELQEAMNPGYLRRMERRIEKENGQEFLLSPAESVR